jgi:hypothetical protein
VVDVKPGIEEQLCVLDNEHNRLCFVAQVLYPSDQSIDIAYLPAALHRPKPEFFPVLTPGQLGIGEDVYTFGSFAIGRAAAQLETGYFGGKVVNFFDEGNAGIPCLTLPCPAVEGMSCSPVLTYHNGPKVVGILIGNRQSRVLASEVIEYTEGGTQYRETVNRIVEFGVAYRVPVLADFLRTIEAPGYLVTDQRVSIPGLE